MCKSCTIISVSVQNVETHCILIVIPELGASWLVDFCNVTAACRQVGWLVCTHPSLVGVPAGNPTFCYGKSPFLKGKSSINGPFSIAMSN